MNRMSVGKGAFVSNLHGLSNNTRIKIEANHSDAF
jgi:hypothetical protein